MEYMKITRVRYIPKVNSASNELCKMFPTLGSSLGKWSNSVTCKILSCFNMGEIPDVVNVVECRQGQTSWLHRLGMIYVRWI